MSNKNKKRIFISHNYQDKPKVYLLRAQLAGKSDLDVIWVEEVPTESDSTQEIQSSIDKKISSSSMMIALVGEQWSNWQEFELKNALEKGVPVVGVISYGNDNINSELLNSGEVPLVRWNWKELSEILSGQVPTLRYSPQNIEVLESPIIQTDFTKISEELIQYLIYDPQALHKLSPRKFEELVAYLMEKHGYEVTLTQQSKDGGVDIFALKKDDFGSFLTIVDCKKYSPKNPVCVDVVRTMYGTLNVENASHGIIATTSRFTADAKKLARKYKKEGRCVQMCKF